MLQKVSTFFPRIVIKNVFFVLQELLDDASDPLSRWLGTKVQHFHIACLQIQTVLEDKTFSHNIFSSNCGTQCVV